MRLKRLDRTNEKECKFVEELYLNSFPPNERRSLNKLYELFTENSSYVMMVIKEDDGENLGFISHWEFDNFIFAEHFAICSSYRNAGHGGIAIDTFVNHHTKPIMLEVELPTDDLSTRRIGFYQRKGFTLWADVPYAQPSFVEGENDVPMHLLTYGELDDEKDLIKCVKEMHKKIFDR